MKPSALRIERLLAKIEAELACSARPRRSRFPFGCIPRLRPSYHASESRMDRESKCE
jgi:hypothetical protein